MVSCDQTVFILTDKGKIRFQRRLEYTPSCLYTYHLGTKGEDIFEDEDRSKRDVLESASEGSLDTPCFMTILGSFQNYLMIYKDVRLVWTAKTERAPIYVNRASFEGKQGLIVTLSDNGFLQVSFLGTQQLTTTAHAHAIKDQQKVNYE